MTSHRDKNEITYNPHIFFEHKGYKGNLEYSKEDKLYFGSIQDIKDSINYHGKTIWDTCGSFMNAVENYIEIKNSINP